MFAKRHITISLRLTLWFGVMFFLGWILFGAAMGLNLRRMLTGERRQTLTRRLDRLQDLLQRTAKEDQASRAEDVRDFANATGNGLSEVFRMDGTRLFPSPSRAAAVFPWPVASEMDSPEFVHVDVAGQPFWVMARRVDERGGPLLLLVGAPGSGNLAILTSFRNALLASVPILLLISSAAGYWISRKALRPVDEITATAQSISIRNLSERLPVSASGDELQRLAETCNEMLARLEAAVNRIKQFTGDASHELRGPISFIRTVAEVSMRNGTTDAESRLAFEEIVEETRKAEALLKDMLTLARADGNDGGGVFEDVDLAEVVQATCAMAQPLAHGRDLALHVLLPKGEEFHVSGDLLSLRRLVWILLDNALKYTGPSGQIDVSLRRDGAGCAVLEVRDTGIGIAPADLPRIFDRFFRADASRGQVEGSGLGLSIARWVAQVHRADLTVASTEGVGTTFRFVIAIEPDAPLLAAEVSQHAAVR